MEKNIQVSDEPTCSAEYAVNISVFYDRTEPPFTRWLEEQGLPLDASDDLVLEAMSKYLNERNTASIT